MINKKKIRSRSLWLAVASLILLILKDWLGLSFDAELYNNTVDLFLFILVTAGIITDADKGNWYKDKEEDIHNG